MKGAAGIVCTLCRQEGHPSRSCPRVTPVAFIPKQARKDPRTKDPDTTRASAGLPRRCSSCGELGHRAPTCGTPALRRPAPALQGLCLVCLSGEHATRECPRRADAPRVLARASVGSQALRREIAELEEALAAPWVRR